MWLMFLTGDLHSALTVLELNGHKDTTFKFYHNPSKYEV